MFMTVKIFQLGCNHETWNIEHKAKYEIQKYKISCSMLNVSCSIKNVSQIF